GAGTSEPRPFTEGSKARQIGPVNLPLGHRGGRRHTECPLSRGQPWPPLGLLAASGGKRKWSCRRWLARPRPMAGAREVARRAPRSALKHVISFTILVRWRRRQGGQRHARARQATLRLGSTWPACTLPACRSCPGPPMAVGDAGVFPDLLGSQSDGLLVRPTEQAKNKDSVQAPP